MYLLRRAAVRSFTASPLQARTLVTRTRSGLGQAQKWQMPVFQQRFASNEASPVDEKTSGETVTTEPTETEQAQKQEAAQYESNDVVEKSVPKAADVKAEEQSKPQQVAEQISTTAQQATSAMRQAASSAAESMLGESARREQGNVGTHGDPRPSRILYVGNLFFEVKAQDLEREFGRFGTVTNARVAEDARGLSRGFGFVEFETLEDAAKAKEELNQKSLAGRNMAVQYHVRREPRAMGSFRQGSAPSKTLFIGNMSFQMSDKDLNELFKPIRNVLDVRVAVDRRSGQPRGFCHADFVDVPSAQAAKEILENKEIYGRRLRIDFSRTNSRRESSEQDE